MNNFIFLLLTFLTQLCWALPEREVRSNWESKLYPFFLNGKTIQFNGVMGKKITGKLFTDSVTAPVVVIFPGQSEAAEKYVEVIWDLRQKGFNVAIIDHRGQGRSERVSPLFSLSHVEKFEYYVEDSINFLKLLKKQLNSPFYLLAHSMGGAIGLGVLQNEPSLISKAILSSPMLQIKTNPYPEFAAKSIALLMRGLGKKATFAPGQKPFYYEAQFESNTLTHSKERFESFIGHYQIEREIVIGGVSNNWIYESLKYTKKMKKKYNQVHIPVLLFQSSNDAFVKPGRQNLFCKEAVDCQLFHFPHSKHELLMESDNIRNQVMNHIFDFFRF